MGKAGLISKITKVVKGGSKGGKVAGGSLKVGAIGGAAGFFGLEWLTNGGLTDSVAGTFNIPEWSATALLLIGTICIGAVVIYALYRRVKGRR